MCELIDLYTPTGTKRMSHIWSDMNKMVEEEFSSLCLHPLQKQSFGSHLQTKTESFEI